MTKRCRIGAALILLAFIATRIGAWWLSRSGDVFGDQSNFLIIADNIAAGRGMVIDDPKLIAGLRAYYPPLYPLLLGLLALVAPLTPAVLALSNGVIDLAAAAAMVALARQLGAPRAGVPAALAYLFWPTTMFFSAMAYKEGLTILFLVTMLVAIARSADRGGLRWAAASGAAAAAMILTTPALAPFAAFAFVALSGRFGSWRTWGRAAGLAAATAVAVMLPWWIRNAVLLDAFVPLTSAGPVAWWIGTQGMGPNQWVQPPLWARQGDELRFAAAMGAEAARVIAADPIAYLADSLAKWPASYGQPSIALYQLQQLDRAGFERWVEPWIAGPMLADAAVAAGALWAAMQHRRSDLARLVWAGVAQVMLVAIWFEFGERQRYFLLPLLLLMLGAALRNHRAGRALGTA